ncbi:hypothetical protein [Roseivivax marinus]|uniref:hypothetical protein n=1 Tax=Roseivivax marinus TaxID=1379903 RepID=UPI00103A45C1|nr:hypothetical protein [Roseivivax marinus]
MKDFTHEPSKIDETFELEQYIGYRLRLARQKYCDIFSRRLPDVTVPQFALLVKLLGSGLIANR